MCCSRKLSITCESPDFTHTHTRTRTHTHEKEREQKPRSPETSTQMRFSTAQGQEAVAPGRAARGPRGLGSPHTTEKACVSAPLFLVSKMHFFCGFVFLSFFFLKKKTNDANK